MNTYTKKEKESQINNALLHLEEIEQKEQTKFKEGKNKDQIRDKYNTELKNNRGYP